MGLEFDPYTDCDDRFGICKRGPIDAGGTLRGGCKTYCDLGGESSQDETVSISPYLGRLVNRDSVDCQPIDAVDPGVEALAANIASASAKLNTGSVGDING